MHIFKFKISNVTIPRLRCSKHMQPWLFPKAGEPCYWDSCGEGPLSSPSIQREKPNKRVPFVVTYHPSLGNLSSFLHKHLPTLHSSEKMKKVFPEPPVVSFKKPKNLKDHLVRSRLDSKTSGGGGGGSFKTCSDKRCQLCRYTTTTSEFASSTSGLKYVMLGSLSCKSRNVIYLITCKKCGKQYVGETGDPLNLRVNNHRSSIRTKKLHLPVAEHFNTDNHGWEDMSVVAIDHNPNWTTEQRIQMENCWQHRLRTIQPDGLNKTQDRFRMNPT